MVLPLWHEDRQGYIQIRPNGNKMEIRSHVAARYSSACLLITNAVSGNGLLFRRIEDYLLFRDIIERHLQRTFNIIAYLFTPHSYEIVLSYKAGEGAQSVVKSDCGIDLKGIASMLSHYVHTVNRKYSRTGPLFDRGYRALYLNSQREVAETVAGMTKAADALDGVFHLPVCMEKLQGHSGLTRDVL